MNLDRFVATHQPVWDRLQRLSSRRVRSLSADEVRQLVDAHQRTATHLSSARTTLRDQALTARLSQLVGTSQAIVYGTRTSTLATIGRFFAETLPAAMWALRRPILLSTAVFLVVAVAMGVWTAQSPEVLDAAIPPALQDLYAEEEFVDYYRDLPPGEFTALVGVNNVRVAVLAFVVGIAGGVWTVAVLVGNAVSIGVIAGLMHSRGLAGVFWGFILPHGLLELTCIFIAGGTGIALGWSWVAPGDRPRREALREEGSRAVAVVIGVGLMLGVSALIEGFVTGSDLPVLVKVTTGAIVWGALLVAIVLLGSDAADRGLTGTLRQSQRATWADDPTLVARGQRRPRDLASR